MAKSKTPLLVPWEREDKRGRIAAKMPIILNFNDDIYHKEIKLFLKNFIRDEQKFENIDELKNQILDDIESAKKYR